MTHIRLAQQLGQVSSQSYRRNHNETLINVLAHQTDVSFASINPVATVAAAERSLNDDGQSNQQYIAHQAGVNCLCIDSNEGRYLFTGGADSAVRMWDLEDNKPSSQHSATARIYAPKATISRSTPVSHTHALTSISLYPFDPAPTTLITTSYDKTVKVTSVTSSSLTPIHTFPLDYAPHTHAVSSHPDSQPLIAVGTAHPSIRLLDLRSGLGTHSLSGANGAIYTLAWFPKSPHILTSGSSDGKVLFYDIRRANAAFASLDHDDSIGVHPHHAGHRPENLHLNFSAVAHAGAVTSVQFTPSGDKIVTTGHDQRIRIWDTATGRNDLVHFGPRVKNDRMGPLAPLISPPGSHKPGQESLFWPNDDGRGMIFRHHLREGHILRILRTEGVKIAQIQAQAQRRGRASGRNINTTVNSGGRINGMVWRCNAISGEGVEMYTAHGDGRICAWLPQSPKDDDVDEEGGDAYRPARSQGLQHTQSQAPAPDAEETEAENRRKRKRALIGDLVEGLTKRPITFS